MGLLMSFTVIVMTNKRGPDSSTGSRMIPSLYPVSLNLQVEALMNVESHFITLFEAM